MNPLRVLASHLHAALNEQDCFLCGMKAQQPVCAGCAADCPALAASHCWRCALPLAGVASKSVAASTTGLSATSAAISSTTPAETAVESTAETTVITSAKKSVHAPGPTLCGRCLHAPPHFDATIAAYAYGAPLDQALQAFKYRAALGLGGFLSDALLRAIAVRASATATPSAPAEFAAEAGTAAAAVVPDLIIPMPLFRRRLAERGFNQALELARPLARKQHIALDARAVRRVRDTPPQAGLPWDERARNIQNAFACTHPAAAAGLHVAVVDDVMTTGATLNEMARVLKAAGAARVSNWVVARTLPIAA